MAQATTPTSPLAPAKFLTLVLAMLLVVLSWVGLPSAVWADKPGQALKFDPASGAINVAQIYETTADTQKTVVSGLIKSSKSFFKKTPGFGSFSVLQSADGTRVLALSQWDDEASYEAFLAQPEGGTQYEAKFKKDKQEKAPPIEPNRTLVFQIEDTLAAEGTVPAIRGKDALVQINEITAKSAEDVDKLIASAESLLPSVKQIFPSPRSAALLKQVDGADLVLLTNWGSAAEYEAPELVPTFTPLAEDLLALADNDQHLYEVVKIIAPKPEKDYGSKYGKYDKGE